MNNKDHYTSTMRTIVTNAVCGRATQTCQTTIYISAEENIEPDRILGCAIRNAAIQENNFEGFTKDNMKIRVNGEFEVHVWYEVNGDTSVSKSYANFSEVVPVESLENKSYYEEEYFNKIITAWISKKPVSLGSMIVNKAGLPAIAVQVEYDLGVEVMGEAKINILSYVLDKSKVEKDISFDAILTDTTDNDDD
ncbi:MAG: outer spore coat protein CotE [Firmicutes bacterium]|nr:outer spore coat protein CotE [Bacillota bacterium]